MRTNDGAFTFKSFKDLFIQYKLQKALDTTTYDFPWFHGKMSREEARELLRNKPAGTFLIRFSKRAGHLAASYVDRNMVVAEALIACKPNYKFLDTRNTRESDNFQTLKALLEGHSPTFKTPYENYKSSASPSNATSHTEVDRADELSMFSLHFNSMITYLNKFQGLKMQQLNFDKDLIENREIRATLTILWGFFIVQFPELKHKTEDLRSMVPSTRAFMILSYMVSLDVTVNQFITALLATFDTFMLTINREIEIRKQESTC